MFERLKKSPENKIIKIGAFLGAVALTLSGCSGAEQKTAFVQTSCSDGESPVLKQAGDPVIVECNDGAEIDITSMVYQTGEPDLSSATSKDNKFTVAVSWRHNNSTLLQYGAVGGVDPNNSSRAIIDMPTDPKEVVVSILPQENK